ncbi:hypothetical protein GLAREA_09493 [Glarea lozoyensis ATCC 20868]|uniref:Uncharacterized protein n=1 Tax=Glarea lozoyensis (strain ATCC 20868 / MF5171) TaxID=1116229 RepID=S3DPK0_GLAL2|nr:uncharacterized protein GLAREA_09493 [Glarea lozoyensis ATCC 20868]EPE28373.1 hypothetical protein GLAREA_09493 [Glarea lozoyensis ATCC 20868]
MLDPWNRTYEEWSRQELQFLIDARACVDEGRTFMTWSVTTQIFCERFKFKLETSTQSSLQKLFTDKNPHYARMHEEVGWENKGFYKRMICYVARVEHDWAKSNYILTEDLNHLKVDFPYVGWDHMYFKYDLEGRFLAEPNEYYEVRQNEKIPSHLGKDGTRYVEEHKTTLRVWSLAEDTALRDLMAVEPRGTSEGMAAVLQDMFGRGYDHFALGEFWRRNRHRIIACNPEAHPERFNRNPQYHTDYGFNKYGIEDQKPTKAPGAGPFAWNDKPSGWGLFYLGY